MNEPYRLMHFIRDGIVDENYIEHKSLSEMEQWINDQANVGYVLHSIQVAEVATYLVIMEEFRGVEVTTEGTVIPSQRMSSSELHSQDQ